MIFTTANFISKIHWHFFKFVKNRKFYEFLKFINSHFQYKILETAMLGWWRWSPMLLFARSVVPSGGPRPLRQAGARQAGLVCGHYRAMLCMRGTSRGPVAVCLSVTSRSSTKTAKRRITQTTPHDSPGTLVFWRQRFPRNSTGLTSYRGTKCKLGGSKSATFDK